MQEITDVSSPRYQSMHREYQTQIDCILADCEEEKKKIPEMQEIIKEEYAKFDVAYKATKAQFASFLDERDWCNVDLIIFNYETGRALDLRDALLQVDMERRNEKLVSALQHASREISLTIRSGLGELRQSVESKMNMLNRSMGHVADTVGGYLSQATEQNKALQSSVQQLVNASATQAALVQGALERKSDTSSDQMANDVRRMRELADYSYYGH